MITKEQAMAASHGDEIHVGGCMREIGPRGGVKIRQERWRVSGRCKTWVWQPERFQLPVKHGMYESDYITDANCGKAHLAEDCYLLGSENTRLVRRMVRETKVTLERMKEGGETVE